MAGLEVIHYRSVDGNHLVIAERGDQVANQLANLNGQDVPAYMKGRGSWIFYYNETGFNFGRNNVAYSDINQVLPEQMMVIPISVSVATLDADPGFLPRAGESSFAQITHVAAESHLTEWVRYDDLSQDRRYLVRDSVKALDAAMFAAHLGLSGNKPPTGTGPGGQPGGRNRSFNAVLPAPAPAPKAPASPPARHTSQGGSSIWYQDMGEREDDDYFVSRSVNSYFQFRGVLGTHSHAHPAGTLVLPVFQVPQESETLAGPDASTR
jgi:hypothetical protein